MNALGIALKLEHDSQLQNQIVATRNACKIYPQISVQTDSDDKACNHYIPAIRTDKTS